MAFRWQKILQGVQEFMTPELLCQTEELDCHMTKTFYRHFKNILHSG